MLVRDLPDHGEEFWALFPTDEDGNTVIEEIDLDKYSDLEPNPDIVARIEALNKNPETA